MFAIRLKELRAEKQISQAELAAMLNISNRTISMYEQGNSEPNVETLAKIAAYFYVSTDYLIGITNSRNPDNRSVSDELNLSDEAVDILKEFPLTISKTNGISLSDVLNAIVINPKFKKLLKSILLYISRDVSDWEKFQKFLSNQFSSLQDTDVDMEETKSLYKATITDDFNTLLAEILEDEIQTYNHIEKTSTELRISKQKLL
jgi:Predicted transcriptional regulators